MDPRLTQSESQYKCYENWKTPQSHCKVNENQGFGLIGMTLFELSAVPETPWKDAVDLWKIWHRFLINWDASSTVLGTSRVHFIPFEIESELDLKMRLRAKRVPWAQVHNNHSFHGTGKCWSLGTLNYVLGARRRIYMGDCQADCTTEKSDG